MSAVVTGGGVLAPGAREALARADVLRGHTDAALTALRELLRAQYYSYLYSAPLTPALLRQDPLWDSLRGDARFQALVQGAR